MPTDKYIHLMTNYTSIPITTNPPYTSMLYNQDKEIQDFFFFLVPSGPVLPNDGNLDLESNQPSHVIGILNISIMKWYFSSAADRPMLRRIILSLSFSMI